MPEQGQERQPARHAFGQAFPCDLADHHSNPHKSDHDMQTVRADERKKCRQKRACLPRIARGDETGEFIEFKTKKYQAERERHAKPEHDAELAFIVQGDNAKPARKTARQQNQRLDQNIRQVENLPTGRTGKCVDMEHGIHRKQRREQNAIRHQIRPKTERRFCI